MHENYFIFIKDGIEYDSRDYDIVVGDLPPIVVPNKRITFEEIPGRDGSLMYSDECYSSYSKTIECAIEFSENTDLTWLIGRGKLILSNEPNREYDVILKNNIELTQIAIYYQNFLLKFEVQPFKKNIEEHILTFTENTFNFNISGNARSLPTIKISGEGDLTLTVNSSSFLIKELESELMIDSELEVVVENGQNSSSKTNGIFPRLKPGLNTFSIVGDMTSIEITYKDTYL